MDSRVFLLSLPVTNPSPLPVHISLPPCTVHTSIRFLSRLDECDLMNRIEPRNLFKAL